MSASVELAREAFRSARWREACAALSAIGIQELGVEDLERLAVSAHLTGALPTGFQAWRRAHAESMRLGDHARAARAAFWLAFTLLNQREIAHGGGWLDRAQHELDGAGRDCVERGHLRYAAGLRAIFSGDVGTAYEAFQDAAEFAERFRDRELGSLARIGAGRCLIYLDRPAEGLALFDEAMVSVTEEEVSPVAVGDSYCTVLDACEELLDVHRVDAWSAAFADWCDAYPDLVLYRGECLLHRAGSLRFHGAWADASAAVGSACDRLRDPTDRHVRGMASHVRADLFRLTGANDAAERTYLEAGRCGNDPQPGLALLRAAQGRLDVGLAALRRSLEEVDDPVGRSRLLPAYIELCLASGDVRQARMASDELTGTASRLPAPALAAEAVHAAGWVLLAEGDSRRGLASLRRVVRLWRELDAPYQEARARVLVGIACRSLGDDEGAALEFSAAGSTLRELGAAPDLAGLAELEGDHQRTPDLAGLTVRERQVLALVSTGRSNRQIAGELVISERTVAGHVGNILTKLALPSRAAATAYAYEHGGTGRSAGADSGRSRISADVPERRNS